jgi:hypothetical protein
VCPQSTSTTNGELKFLIYVTENLFPCRTKSKYPSGRNKQTIHDYFKRTDSESLIAYEIAHAYLDYTKAKCISDDQEAEADELRRK